MQTALLNCTFFWISSHCDVVHLKQQEGKFYSDCIVMRFLRGLFWPSLCHFYSKQNCTRPRLDYVIGWRHLISISKYLFQWKVTITNISSILLLIVTVFKTEIQVFINEDSPLLPNAWYFIVSNDKNSNEYWKMSQI